MKRINSIDTIRGITIFLMVFYHTLDWWLIHSDRWFIEFLLPILGPTGFSGFLFVSGFSAAIAYKSRVKKAASSPEISITQARDIYLIRALLFLAVGLIYNTILALGAGNMKWIWSWFILQTIPVSLLLGWPFLRTPKYLRIGLGIGLLVINDLLSPFANYFLLDYSGPLNIYVVFFYIFYHPIESFTILSYFAMFLFGTVVGDFFFDVNSINDQEVRKKSIKSVFLRPLLIVGIILAVFGVIYRFDDFLYRRTFSAMIYAIGMILIIFAILFYLEEFEIIKHKKRYRFFFYLSYYSFTIYLAHDILYFIFYKQLNIIIYWLVFIGILTFIILLLKVMHKKLGPKASVKAQLSTLSLIIAKRIERMKSRE